MADQEVTTKLVMQGDAGGIVSAMNKAKTEFAGITGAMQTAVGGVTSAFGSLGGIVGTVMGTLAGGTLLSSFVSKAKEVGGEVQKLSKSFGISAEEASVLRIALDDTFIATDDVVAAKARLQKQLVKNEEAFKNLGVQTRDGNNNFRDTFTIMTDVNTKLGEFKEGTDRDVEGIKIYGKGWEEARKTLKLTSEVMEESKKRAEQLHLVFGEEGLKQIKSYKLAMKDIDDVMESMKVQIGMALIPELTNLAVALGDSAVKTIPSFIKGLHSVSAEITRMAMLADKAGGSITALGYYMSGGKFTEAGRWFKEQNQMYEQRYKDNEKILIKMAMAEVGLDENGNPLSKGKAKTGPDKRSTGAVPEGKKSDWSAADAKWVEYYKAFEERKAAQIKSANERELELNQQMYDKGLIGYKEYLQERYRLTASTLDATVEAKKNELIAAQTALKNLKPATDSKGRSQLDKDSGNRADALKKEEEAQKAYLEAVSKAAAAKAAFSFDSEMADYKEAERINGLAVQLFELKGRYEDAARAKALWEQQSVGFTNLNPAEQSLKKDINARSISESALKDRELVNQRQSFMTSLTLGAKGSNKNGDPYLQSQRDAIEQQYQQRLITAERYYGQDAALAEKWGEAKRKASEERDQSIATFEKATWESRISTVGDQMGRLGNVLMQGNKDQFEAGKALAVASAVVNTYMAASAAFAGITAETGGWGIALAAAEAAVAVATGMAQVAQIESTQYTAREKGGSVEAGKTYLIGEKRPELLTMGRDPGYITPYVPQSSSASTVIKPTIVYQISPGVAEAARAEIMRAIPAITNHTMSSMMKAINSGTDMSAAVGRM